MSLEENKDIVRRYQEAYNTKDFEALAEVLAADVITPNIISGMPPGIEGAKAVHQKTLLGMPDYYTTIEDLIAEGDKVVARVTMTGTHTGNFYGIAPTGRRVNLTSIYIVRIAEGKIVEHWGEEDGVAVLKQLGFKIKLEPIA
ncbi:MAG TPA: ester cyclase [Anaerolineales bacterium]|nr:ester cyclase [Anaerolineales bacterium]